MALTNAAYFSPSGGGVSISVTLNAGSGNNRKVVSIGLQRRGSGVNLASPTLDGNAATGQIVIQDNGITRAIAHYWDDGDMPASSGAYTLAYTGPDANAGVAGYYVEQAKQGVPADAQSSSATASSASFSVTADSGSTYFIGSAVNLVGVTFTAGGDQTLLIDETVVDKVQAEYKTLDGSVDHSWSSSAAHASIAFAIEPAGSTPSLDDVGGNDTVVVGDTEALTYSNFTTPIETATINDGGTATTSLTVSSAGATSANIQLADLDAWVNTKACPFTSAAQTSQQVTITSTNEDPDETASRAVTFNPPSGYFVTELTSNTWPAPEGSIYKGFASQPPIGMQFAHNLDVSGANGVSAVDGIVTTDVLTNQTVYAWNPTTEEGSSFQFLIESGSTEAGISLGITNGIKEAITRGGLI